MLQTPEFILAQAIGIVFTLSAKGIQPDRKYVAIDMAEILAAGPEAKVKPPSEHRPRVPQLPALETAILHFATLLERVQTTRKLTADQQTLLNNLADKLNSLSAQLEEWT